MIIRCSCCTLGKKCIAEINNELVPSNISAGKIGRKKKTIRWKQDLNLCGETPSDMI